MTIYENEETGLLIRTGSKSDAVDAFLGRMGKRAGAWEAALEDLDKSKVRAVMVTLTYRSAGTWEKGQITEYRQAVENQLGENLFAYFWWGQMQAERFEKYDEWVVHYHMVIVMKRGAPLSMPDKNGMWVHGDSNMKSLPRWGQGVGYALHGYAGSGRAQWEGPFPKGMHKFEVWIKESGITALSYWIYRLSAAPDWVGDRARQMVGVINEMAVPKLVYEDYKLFGRVVGRVGVWMMGKVKMRSPWRWVTSADWFYEMCYENEPGYPL